MTQISYRQLLPRPRDRTAAELLAQLDAEAPIPADRPYTLVSFVTSADGRTALDGSSRALSDAGDRELHRSLREHADAVLAGSATVAAESYGRMLPAAERRARRLALGRPAEPLAVLASRSGRLPLHVPLFDEPEARVVVFSPAAPAARTRARLAHEPWPGDEPRPLLAMLRTLRRGHGVRSLLCEGGALLFGALLAEGLVDELWLTVAPTLAGAVGPAVASGPPPQRAVSLTLAGLTSREDSLFLRYRVNR